MDDDLGLGLLSRSRTYDLLNVSQALSRLSYEETIFDHNAVGSLTTSCNCLKLKLPVIRLPQS